MKKFIIGVGLAALLATPALAQSYDPDYGTGNTNPMPPSYSANADTTGATGAYAYAPSRETMQSEPPVYAFGHYAGTDPDPNIRFQLKRDWPGRD
jgi:opacity protein-like surface antigen